MYNQEQLAAIAAAMSILQQSMQSDPTSNAPPQSSTTSATSNATTTSSSAPNNGNNIQLADLQQQLAAITAAAAATLTQQQSSMHHHQRNDDHHHQLTQHQQLGNSLYEQLQQSSMNGLASLASLEAALPPANSHNQMQHVTARQLAASLAANNVQHQPSPINTDTSQHPLLDRFQTSQFNRLDLDLTPSAPNQANQMRLDDGQQLLLDHLQAIRLQQQHQQQQQLQQQQQDLQNLNNRALPPKFSQQQHQHQQHLLEQYQAKIQESHQLQSGIASLDALSLKQTRAMTEVDKRPHQIQTEQDQHQIMPPSEAPKVAKPTRPISYSAVVAKSAGLTATNGTPVTNDPPKAVSNNNNNEFNLSRSNFGGLAASNNAMGDGLSRSTVLHNSVPAFNGTNIQSIGGDSDPLNGFNGSGTIDSHSLRVARLQMTNAANSIVRNSLNNHIPNSTNYEIFNTNNVTGNSLGQTNGSTLLKHHDSKSLSAQEANLDSYIIEHPDSPAQQLFNNQQNNTLRQNQLPIRMSYQQQQQQQHQSNNHSTGSSDIIINTNSRDKSVPAYGRATNLLGFMGLYVGNLSPDLSKEQLEKIFSKYGDPVKAHRLIRSPVAFIKYENTESPRAAIDDLYNLLLPELTLNPDQPLKLHFDRNDSQLKANYRPTDLPKDDNGECYGWRTTVCKRGKSCPKKHIPINRGIDFQMWMIKANSTSATTIMNPSSATLIS